MSQTALLYPVFVHTVLVMVLLIATGRARARVIRARQLRLADIALGERVWPPKVQQLANAYQNQFELPVLFYVVVLMALVLNLSSLALVVLAWLFVLSRLVHARIHVTTNNVMQRLRAFVAGVIALGTMWVLLLVQVILA
jgi:hypothetical protein